MSSELSFQELSQIAQRVSEAFESHNRKPWTIETSVIELAKQTGDLARTVLMREGYYLEDRANRPEYASTDNAIGDELADILFRIMIIAQNYEINLEEAHLTARRREMQYLGLIATF